MSSDDPAGGGDEPTSSVDRLAAIVTGRSKTVIAVLLVATLLLGAGAGNVEETTGMEMFAEEPSEVETERYVQEKFAAFDGNTTQLVVAVRNGTGNVLSRESLLASLRYQQSLRDNGTVNRTLVDGRATFGIGNLVATTAIQQERSERAESEGESAGERQEASVGSTAGDLPPLSVQIEQLESMSDRQVRTAVERLLDPETGERGRTTAVALQLLPESYEAGTAEATGRLLVVTQETDGLVVSLPELSEQVREGQVAARGLADDVPRDEYRLSGSGLLLVEEQQSIGDSFSLVGPIALLFVLLTLAVAYRDLLDLALGVLGILFVLVWTFGAMGWLGIDFSLIMIITPVLLIGLSIDYCIHVVMRYREHRTGNADDERARAETGDGQPPGTAIRPAMRDGLTGLGPALVLVTITAMLGFLSILTSRIPALSDFAVVTAVGLLGALVVFGALVPALKVELDGLLAARGHDRTSRAFGTTGRLGGLLAGVARVSARRPVAILLLALLVSSVGVAAGAQLETSFSTEDYVAEDAPDWTDGLPGSLAPGEYDVRETQQYLFANFQSPDQQVDVVIRGDLTDPGTLGSVAAAERDAANRSVTFTGPTGEPAVTGPVTAMGELARTNDTFAARLARADTDGDGVPERNVTALLEEFSRTAPARAERLLDRTEAGEYGAGRIAVTVNGTAGASTIAGEMRAVADGVACEACSAGVAGRPIVNELTQRQLATTTVQGLAVTLVTVLAVLVVAFWYKQSSASLGVVTLVPVLLGLGWILGAMYLLGVPVSFATAMIGSIAIGLGVDYAIHMSERYGEELERHGDVERALEASVVGTGGALLGSAATTAGGFGVLTFALVPTLQQFGLIVALTLVFAFVASVLVLPSLLVVWSRYAPVDVGAVHGAEDVTT